MKIVIIEDETTALKRLHKLLLEIDATVQLVGTADSIVNAIQLFQSDLEYDVVFMDIHLADGASFEIFTAVDILKPLIFVTAYDEYAIKAFKVNALDYILKPVKKTALELAFQKVRRNHHSNAFDYKKLAEAVQRSNQQKRFLIRIGQQIKLVEIREVAYFYTQDKITFLITNNGKRYPIDNSLEKLEDLLDQRSFFRINRQFIVGLHAIKEMFTYSKSRVKINLQPNCELETIVSTERSPNFKHWLVGEG